MFLATLISYIAVLNCDGSGVSEQEMSYITTSLRNSVAASAKGQYKVMDSETIAEVIGPEEQKCLAGKCTYAIAKKLQAKYGVSCSLNKVDSKILTSIEVYSSSGDYILGYQPFVGDTLSISREITEKFPSVIANKITEYTAKPEAKPDPKPEPRLEEKAPNSNPLYYYCGRTFKDYILEKKVVPTNTVVSQTPFFEIEQRKQRYGKYGNIGYPYVAGRSALKFKKEGQKELIFYGNNLDIFFSPLKNGEYDIDLNDDIMRHTIHKIISGAETVCDVDSEEFKKAVADRIAAEKAAAAKIAAEKDAAEKERVRKEAAVVHVEDAAKKDAKNIYAGWCGFNIDQYIKSWGRNPHSWSQDSVRYIDENYYADVYLSSSRYDAQTGSKLITAVYLRSKENSIKPFEVMACIW